MALLPEVNGQKRVVLLGGVEKNRQVIQAGSHYRQEFSGNYLVISFSIHVYVWITSLFYLADDRITIRHSRGIESWFHDVDNSKDNNGNKFTIALNPYTGTVLPILRSHLDLFSISERHFSRQKGISSTGIGADRNLPVWGDKYRNVKPKSKQSLKIVTISLINLFNIFDLINYRIFQHLS